MKRLLCCFIALFSLSSFAFGYTTPGENVFWTVDSLFVHAPEAVQWHETDAAKVVFSEQLIIAASDTLLLFDDLIFDVETEGDEDINIAGYLYLGNPALNPSFSMTISGLQNGPGGIKVDEGGTLEAYNLNLPGGGAEGAEDGIRSFGGAILMDGCDIYDWAGAALRFSGTESEVTRSHIHDNHGYGLTLSLGSGIDMTDCHFANNNLATPESGKTNLSLGPQGINTAEISYCTFKGSENNRAGGIALWSFAEDTPQQLSLTECIIEDCAFGVTLRGPGVTAEIEKCLLRNNTSHSDPMTSGSGIAVNGAASLTATNNVITGNYWGITIPPADAVPAEISLTGNSICDNINNEVEYNLYNNSSLNFAAEDNYWGATTAIDAEATIVHSVDNEALGTVDFEPIKTTAGPVITSFTPQNCFLRSVENKNLTFSVEAEDVDSEAPLRYMWFADATYDPSATGNSFPYITSSDLGLIACRVLDADDNDKQFMWIIIPCEQYVPEITSATPSTQTFALDPGARRTFTISAIVDPDDQQVRYAITVNDELISHKRVAGITFEEAGEYVVKAYTYVGNFNDSARRVAQVWNITVGDTGADEDAMLPTEFAMNTYPNPFNEQLQVAYSLPTDQTVTVQVYSLEGRLVDSFDMGTVPAGQHRFTWNASSCASGVYFVKINAGRWTSVRKVVLLR